MSQKLFSSWQVYGIYLFKCTELLWGPHKLPFSWIQRPLCGAKALGYEIYHSPILSTEAKNGHYKGIRFQSSIVPSFQLLKVGNNLALNVVYHRSL
jgi:hypothetical protein